MKVITLAHVEFVSFKLAREMLEYNEPIPDFSTRFPNVLESCLLTPFQSLGGAANALSYPPGEYGRKIKTQRN